MNKILLDKNFRDYLKTIMVSKKIMRMVGLEKTPLQKTYEMNIGQDSIDIDFLSANRQFYWIEISLVYNKCNKQHNL